MKNVIDGAFIILILKPNKNLNFFLYSMINFLKRSKF